MFCLGLGSCDYFFAWFLCIFKMCFFVCKIFVTYCSLSLAAKALLTSVECMLSSPVACSTWHPTLAPFLLYHKYMFFPCMRAIWEFWDRSQNNHAAGSTFFWFKLRCSKTPRFPPAKWWSHLPLPSGNPEGSWGERVWNHSNQRWADKLGSWNWLGVQMNTIHGYTWTKGKSVQDDCRMELLF